MADAASGAAAAPSLVTYTYDELKAILANENGEWDATREKGEAEFIARIKGMSPPILRELGAGLNPQILQWAIIGNARLGIIVRMHALVFLGSSEKAVPATAEKWRSIVVKPRASSSGKRARPDTGAGAGAGAEPAGAGPGAGAGAGADPAPVASVKRSATMKLASGALYTRLDTADESSFKFRSFGRPRTGILLREIAAGVPLASYQMVAAWAATQIALGFERGTKRKDPAQTLVAKTGDRKGVDMTSSLMLYWDTGAGKTAALWAILGEMYAAGRSKNVFFVTRQPLAVNRQPDDDVYGFYMTAGTNAYKAIRAGAPKDTYKKGKKGAKKEFIAAEKWRAFPLAGDYEETRVVSYRRFMNAMLVRNELGRATYGTAMTDMGYTPLSRKLQEYAYNKDALDADNFPVIDYGKNDGEEIEDPSQWRVIDPLFRAAVVIDEADQLFNPLGDIGDDGAKVIERAIFSSYDNAEKKDAVFVALATATPVQTSVAVTFRLLNILVRDKAWRVHGVGSAGEDGRYIIVDPETSITVEKLRGTGGAPFETPLMYDFMNQVGAGSISRVNLEKDFDNFPHRHRHTVTVKPTGPAHAAAYSAFTAARFPILRTAGSDYEDEDEIALNAAEAAAEAAEGAGPAMNSLRTRAVAIRRFANMLPRDGESPTTFPPEFLLGHPDYSRDAFAAHITDEPDPAVSAAATAAAAAATGAELYPLPSWGRAPKLLALLREIHTIDRTEAAAGRALPKHLIVCDTPGIFGAPLVAAALDAAGYTWRPFVRTGREVEFVNFDAATQAWTPPATSPGGATMPETTKSTHGSRTFVVMDSSLVDHGREVAKANAHSERASTRVRVYTDFEFSPIREVMTALVARGADVGAVGEMREKFVPLSRRRLYFKDVAVGSSLTNVFSSFYIGMDDSSLSDQLSEMIRLYFPEATTLEALLAVGLVRWAPGLTAKQRASATRSLTKHFNSTAENENGDFARIVVISPAFATGTSFFNVEHMHLFDAMETVADGEGGVPITRDRIQYEGRAYRRGAHWRLREKNGGHETTLHIRQYELNAGQLNADQVIDYVRSKRPVPETLELLKAKAAAETKEPGSPEAEALDDIEETMAAFRELAPILDNPEFTMDEMVRILGRDPLEQAKLQILNKWFARVAFDRDVNKVTHVEGPLYTGYAVTEASGARIPLYRRSATDKAFVSADGVPWSAGAEVSLAQMFTNGQLHWDPTAGTWEGVPDSEQGFIEVVVLEQLSRQLDGLLRLSAEAGTAIVQDAGAGAGAGAAAAAAGAGATLSMWKQRAIEIRETHIGVDKKKPDWHSEARAAVTAVMDMAGIIEHSDWALDLWLGGHIHVDSTSVITQVIRAWTRARATRASVPFDAAAYVSAVLGADEASLAATASHMNSVLAIAAWQADSTKLADELAFYSMWGHTRGAAAAVVAAIGIFPGETELGRQKRVFLELSSRNVAKWRRLLLSAAQVFGAADGIGTISKSLRKALADRIIKARAAQVRAPAVSSVTKETTTAAALVVPVRDFVRDVLTFNVQTGARTPTILYGELLTIAARLSLAPASIVSNAILDTYTFIQEQTLPLRYPTSVVIRSNAISTTLASLVQPPSAITNLKVAIQETLGARGALVGDQDIANALAVSIGDTAMAAEALKRDLDKAEFKTGLIMMKTGDEIYSSQLLKTAIGASGRGPAVTLYSRRAADASRQTTLERESQIGWDFTIGRLIASGTVGYRTWSEVHSAMGKKLAMQIAGGAIRDRLALRNATKILAGPAAGHLLAEVYAFRSTGPSYVPGVGASGAAAAATADVAAAAGAAAAADAPRVHARSAAGAAAAAAAAAAGAADDEMVAAAGAAAIATGPLAELSYSTIDAVIRQRAITYFGREMEDAEVGELTRAIVRAGDRWRELADFAAVAASGLSGMQPSGFMAVMLLPKRELDRMLHGVDMTSVLQIAKRMYKKDMLSVWQTADTSYGAAIDMVVPAVSASVAAGAPPDAEEDVGDITGTHVLAYALSTGGRKPIPQWDTGNPVPTVQYMTASDVRAGVRRIAAEDARKPGVGTAGQTADSSERAASKTLGTIKAVFQARLLSDGVPRNQFDAVLAGMTAHVAQIDEGLTYHPADSAIRRSALKLRKNLTAYMARLRAAAEEDPAGTVAMLLADEESDGGDAGMAEPDADFSDDDDLFGDDDGTAEVDPPVVINLGARASAFARHNGMDSSEN